MHAIPRRRLAAVAIAVSLTAPLALSVGGAAAGAATGSATSPVSSTAPFCGITWGSLPKATSPDLHWTGNVVRTRYGQHTCYDRLVFDIAPGHGAVGYNVRYVNQVTGPGSGLPVPVAGGARIQITINAPSTLAGTTTNFVGWRTFRQLKGLGSFEGYTDYGLGVRARLPMRVLVLTDADGGRRLVVDVAHRW
ncbi:hypothetical protein GCM10009817_29770 [Terrabacter lapilli]|uniref:AMIN-like domain-containing protein n=1 Tax=Terrabacter lapilli TaxID=436231 RepID=A0ABN2SGP5_9MICO|nr:hypothetical protein [Terrabacter sp.]